MIKFLTYALIIAACLSISIPCLGQDDGKIVDAAFWGRENITAVFYNVGPKVTSNSGPTLGGGPTRTRRTLHIFNELDSIRELFASDSIMRAKEYCDANGITGAHRQKLLFAAELDASSLCRRLQDYADQTRAATEGKPFATDDAQEAYKQIQKYLAGWKGHQVLLPNSLTEKVANHLAQKSR